MRFLLTIVHRLYYYRYDLYHFRVNRDYLWDHFVERLIGSGRHLSVLCPLAFNSACFNRHAARLQVGLGVLPTTGYHQVHTKRCPIKQ